VPLVSQQSGVVAQYVGRPRDPSSTEYLFVTVWEEAVACASAGAAPSAASPINMARTVPRIVFNTRIVPQFETFGWHRARPAGRTCPGLVSTPVRREMQAVEGAHARVYRACRQSSGKE